MINVMLDELPEEWEGYQLNTSFRVGMQIILIEEDKELSKREKVYIIMELLFKNDRPENVRDIETCLDWFINGWNHDNFTGKKSKGKKKKVARQMDFDRDQWRIYSAFLSQYRINLAEEDMHWWEFMGLLSCLEECAYTKVIEIRNKKIESGMSPKEKQAIKQAHEIYALEEDVDELTPQERERYENFMKYRKRYN